MPLKLRFTCMRIIITSFLFLVAVSVVSGAEYNKEYRSIPVIEGGVGVDIPFWGGISSVSPSLVDFDADGRLDLLLGETGGKVSYLRNVGTAQFPQWEPVAERLGGVDAGLWHTLADIDADGDLDFFVDSRAGTARFYRTEISSGVPVLFLQDSAFAGLQIYYNCAPTFCDIDADHDSDFFVGNTFGGLDFWRNDGDSANPSFAFITEFYDSVYAFPGIGRFGQAMHGASSITFHDVDSDSDPDLFYGDILNRNCYYFKNLGAPDLSDLTKVRDDYLPYQTLNGQNHVALGDIDADGDPDLLLSGSSGDLIKNLVLLRNQGTPTQDSFVVDDERFLRCLDAGENSVPALGDVDGDGDSDLLLGNEYGTLVYYENTGTRWAPEFILVTDSFQNIDVGASSAPELVDWDYDGDLDLLLGMSGNNFGGGAISAKVQFWRNSGDRTQMTLTLDNPMLGNIKVDANSIPRAVDLDDDGLLDLLVGEWDYNGNANLLLYRNSGDSANPAFSLVRTRTLANQSFRDFTLPTIVDWDNDGRKDVIVGGRLYGLTLFRNTSAFGVFPDSLTLIAQGDTLPGSDDGFRSASAFSDIDADGDFDVFVGESEGGLNFYRASASAAVRGDINHNGFTDIADVSLLAQFLFVGQGVPLFPATADVNCSTDVTIADVIYLLRYLFGQGPAPCP